MKRMMPVLAGLLTIPGLSLANTVIPEAGVKNVSLVASVGVLNGRAGEYVYDNDTGRRVSHLDWRINHTPVVRASLSWDAGRWVSLDV